MTSLKPNTVLGEVYQVLHLIGEGASGSVYKAQHLLTQDYVAIKVIQNNQKHDHKVMSHRHLWSSVVCQ